MSEPNDERGTMPRQETLTESLAPEARNGRYRFDHSGMEQGDHLLYCRSAYQLVTGYADFIEFTPAPA